MQRRGFLGLFAILVAVLALPAAARADMGPKPTLTVRLVRAGKPLAETGLKARLLACGPADAGPSERAGPLPGLEQMDLQDPSGCVWQEQRYGIYGNECADGACTFSGFLPSPFRLAAYVPSEGRVYLSEPAERRGMHGRYLGDLQADGSVRLSLQPVPLYDRDWTLAGVLVALPLTLAVELAVVWGYGRITRKPIRRVFWVCLGANAITLPCVWLAGGLGFMFSGVAVVGWLLLALAEGGAWAVEAVLYTAVGRLTLLHGVLLSLVANLASVAIGFFVH